MVSSGLHIYNGLDRVDPSTVAIAYYLWFCMVSVGTQSCRAGCQPDPVRAYWALTDHCDA